MKQVCLNIYNYRKELESLYLQNNLKLLPHLLNLNRPISFSSQLVQKKINRSMRCLLHCPQ